jgi:hypothetical protein
VAGGEIVEKKPERVSIPEIWLTEEEKSLSIGQLKYCYLQIARQRFQGKVFTNISKIKKPYSGNMARLKIRSTVLAYTAFLATALSRVSQKNPVLSRGN